MEITKYLKPFDKVLVRDDDSELWKIEFFERYNHPDETYPYVGLRAVWKQCIPFEGNEHLLTKPLTDEFKFGDHVEVSDNNKGWYKAVFITIYNNKYKALTQSFVDIAEWNYCRKSDW